MMHYKNENFISFFNYQSLHTKSRFILGSLIIHCNILFFETSLIMPVNSIQLLYNMQDYITSLK